MRHTLTQLAGCLVAVVVLTSFGDAKPPTVHGLFPAGGQQGTIVAVTTDGTFDGWPVEAWTSTPAISVTALETKGQISVAIDAEASPGQHWIRLYDASGSSRMHPFLVDSVKEILEGDATQSEIDLSKPTIINGRLSANQEVDQYNIDLPLGATVVASLDAHRFVGSPMDAVMQLYDREHRVVLHQVDDAPGRDPRIVISPTSKFGRRSNRLAIRLFAFPETPNQRIGFAGGKNFIYRLTLSQAGFVDFATPLSVMESGIDAIRLTGWGLDDHHRAESRRSFRGNETVATAFLPNVPGFSTVSVEAHACHLESPDCSEVEPISCLVPSTTTGHLDSPNDIDGFTIRCQKEQPLSIRVDARSLDFPTDPLLELYALSPESGATSSHRLGKRLHKTDDTTGRDCVLQFNPPETATYMVTVRDLYGGGGPRHRYRLTVTEQRPTFRLNHDNEVTVGKVGEATKIDVSILRQHALDRNIYVAAIGLPSTVRTRVEVSMMKATSSSTGNETSKTTNDSSKKVTLVLKASEPVSTPFQIIGVSHGQAAAVRSVTPTISTSVATSDLWFTATAADPVDADSNESSAEEAPAP